MKMILMIKKKKKIFNDELLNYSQKLKQKFCRSNSDSEFIALNISLSVWSFSRCMCIRKILVLRLIEFLLMPASSQPSFYLCPVLVHVPAHSLLCLALSLRCYMLRRRGIASPLPPSCSVTASAASSPPTPTCSIRLTCRPPSLCRTGRNHRRTRDPAPSSSVTPSSRWS